MEFHLSESICLDKVIMTLPASGPISFAAINAELGNASNAQISLNDINGRNLAGISSGLISFSSFYGKSTAPVPGFIEWGNPGSYSFVVPANVRSLVIILVGGGGGGGGGTLFPGSDNGPAGGGGSGYITQTTIAVTPGETLTVDVAYGGGAGAVGYYTTGQNGGNGGVSQIRRGATVIASIAGGGGGIGCYSWSGTGIWGNCGQIASPGGIGRFNGGYGGAGNNDWNSSYVPGNGAGVGEAAVFATRGGNGLNGFVGAAQVLTRWQGYMWLQGSGYGGGGYIGSASGMNGGAGGGGGGGGLGGGGGAGGHGYVKLSWG